MRSIWTIGWMTFVEARRNRILWSLLFFCLALVLTSFLFQEVTVASFDRVVRDVGLASIHIFGVVLAVFLGATVVSREIERRTLYSMLARPLSRAAYLAGKLLGVWITLATCLGLMLAAFLVECVVYRGAITSIIFETFGLILIELFVIASFSIFVSTFTSTVMTGFMSISLFVAGHATEEIYFFARKSKSVFNQRTGAIVYHLLPNFERLNFKAQASTLEAVPLGEFIKAGGYGLVYALAFFLLAVASFRRRDLK